MHRRKQLPDRRIRFRDLPFRCSSKQSGDQRERSTLLKKCPRQYTRQLLLDQQLHLPRVPYEQRSHQGTTNGTKASDASQEPPKSNMSRHD
jgi:hypothetical protein